MRRGVVIASLLVPLAAATGCSFGGTAPVAVTHAASATLAGNPTDTASPTGPSPAAASVNVGGALAATASPTGTLDLPGCMIGSWTAQASREFGNLGLAKRSDGTAHSATGTLNLEFTAEKKWTFTYEAVKVELTLGTADVSGPITGSWTLAGNTLSTTISRNDVVAKITAAGLTVDAPHAVTDVLQTLPPDQAFVTCTGNGLQFQLPASQGGGTVTFDAD